MAGSPLRTNIARVYSSVRNQVYNKPQITIEGVDPKNFPSALQPVQPMGPPGSKPLGWNYWTGTNQQLTPRPDAALTFADLRSLAEYPLARICIESVKDLLASFKWSIQLRSIPGQSAKDRKAAHLNDKNIPALTALFEYPDGMTPWPEWIRPLIEDMLVVDAGSIIVESTLSGKVGRLRVVDGTQFLKLIDDQGYTPQSGPAYTQLWNGQPRLLLTPDQLIYRPSNITPRNTQASKMYGYSITEQLAPEIVIGRDRMASIGLFYTAGSVPGVIHVVPGDVESDKFEEIQGAMTSQMAGQLDKMRQYRYVQGFKGRQDAGTDQIVQLKEPTLADVFDDLHIRKIAFGYGTSAQRLQKTLNRASAEAGQDASEKEGLMPRLRWLKGTIDIIIQRRMGFPGYEWVPDTDDELDPEVQAKVDDINIKNGKMLINEAREARGLDPLPQPEANAPMIITASGAVPLGGTIDRTAAQHAADIEPPSAPIIQAPSAGNDPRGDSKTKASAKSSSGKKKLSKSGTSPIISAESLTARNERLAGALKISIAKFFKLQAKSIAKQVAAAYKASPMSKAEETDDQRLKRHAAEAAVLLANVDWGWFNLKVEYDLEQASLEGSDIAEESFTATPEITEYVERGAQQYASSRAAEMIGMRRNEKGELVENPNAKYAISRTTREDVLNTIIQAREEGWTASQLSAVLEASTTFSSARARLIAETEMMNAQSYGTYIFWMAGNKVQTVQWETSGLENVCPMCDGFANQGEVPLGHEFSPGVRHPQAHVKCDCSLKAVKIAKYE